jgi:hypothetical protein
MSQEQLLARPVPGKWTTMEVVCHLADSEQSWAHRMKRIIAEERPLLIGYDESHFAKTLFYHEHDVAEELALIEQTRAQMAKILRKVPSSAWDRTGIHTERGLITLKEMLDVEVAHIPHHVRFIEEKRRALGLRASKQQVGNGHLLGFLPLCRPVGTVRCAQQHRKTSITATIGHFR